MIQHSRWWLLMATGLVCVGCSSEATPKKPAEGVEVNWPGGSFKYDAEKGVEVKAQDVDVNVNQDSDVNVKTPNTRVRANQEEGIEIQTPQSDVQVK